MVAGSKHCGMDGHVCNKDSSPSARRALAHGGTGELTGRLFGRRLHERGEQLSTDVLGEHAAASIAARYRRQTTR
jgi:hypothetical protein